MVDNPNKRVALFSNHATIIGGGEISFIDLVDTLRKHCITPIAFVPGKGEVYDKLHKRGLPPIIYQLPPIRLLMLPKLLYTLFSIVRTLLQYKIDIVHTNGARCMLIVGLAAKLCKIPVVWHVRVMERDRYLDRIRSILAKIIIANSAAVAQTLKPHCDDFSKVAIIYNGIDTSTYLQFPPVNLQQLFSIPNKPVVLAVGRLCGWKRFHILIDACRVLQKSGPEFTCLIIGQDSLSEPQYCRKLRSMPQAYGLSNVVFGDWRTDVPSIMKSATLLVLPSDHEPFGRVIIEAWACGLPVIATNAGGPAEIITSNESGILIPIDDSLALAESITLLLTDNNIHSRLSKNGLIEVEHFSLDAHAKSVAAVYQKIGDTQ